MAASKPLKDPLDLQIIRTRHPPLVYLEQFALINTESGWYVSPADVQRRLETLPRSDRLLLAVTGETLLGYAHLRIAHDLLNEETAEVVSIIVRQSHRRRNIGRRLINAAETWARESGRARLLMRTEVVRSEAHAFFVALGYEQAATTLEFIRVLDESP
jgi:GNAT superfamily N-acetyltransferase